MADLDGGPVTAERTGPAPRLDPADGGVCFIQTWEMPAEAQLDGWLATMHERIHVLTSLPGFRSMSLHRGLDGTHAAVYAQWDSLRDLQAGRDGAPAREGHAALAQWGHETGHAYLLEAVYRLDPRRPSR